MSVTRKKREERRIGLRPGLASGTGGKCCSSGACLDAELLVDVLEVLCNRRGGESEVERNLPVSPAACNTVENLSFR